MNKVILIGRLTRDPDVRYTQGDNPMCIARYALAVDRKLSADQRQQEQLSRKRSKQPFFECSICPAFLGFKYERGEQE